MQRDINILYILAKWVHRAGGLPEPLDILFLNPGQELKNQKTEKTKAEEQGHSVKTVQHDYPKLNASMGYFKWSRDIVRDYMLKCLQLEYMKDPAMYTIVITHSNATWGISRVIGKYYSTSTMEHINFKIDLLI